MAKTYAELMAREREVNSRLGELNEAVQSRELTEEEKKEQRSLDLEFKNLQREITAARNEADFKQRQAAPVVNVNAELREFLRNAPKGKGFSIPMTRESMSYQAQQGGYAGTGDFVQGLTIVDLIDTERKDGDILATAGVPMMTGVRGNKIQWAYAGGVEAVFANELAQTTERVIDLDKQVPVQQRLTVRVRISNQALENTDFDLQGYIVRHVASSIREKVNWAAASTTKATEVFYGGFAQNAESGTYGSANYVPGKQVGTYTAFSKETAAEMIAKLASRNLKLDNVVFVMGSEDFWKLKVTPMDAGSGIMLIGNDNRLLGIPVIENNAINRATQKGAVSGHNIGLGNFKYLPTLQWGNLRLSVDANSAVASNTDEVITTVNADFSMTVLKDGADAFVVYSKTNTPS